MKKTEQENRNNLKLNKPLVYNKIINNQIAPIIQLQYSFKCNFNCEHCSIKGFQHKDRRHLTPTDIKDVFDQADALGLARVTITGGEPLVFKDLDELIEAIGPERFWINLDTNCWLLTDELAKHLKTIGVDRLQPSLDSLDPDEHDNFRKCKGSHERVMKSIDIAKRNNLGIFMQTVVTKSRLHSQEFLDYLSYFNGLGISVFVSFAKPVGAWEGHFEELIDKEDLKYMEELEKKYNVFTHLTPGYGVNEERLCVAARNIFSITAHGDVLPCPYFHCSMGNVFNEPLKDILERCQALKPFKKQTCLVAEDREFINKYLVNKIYGKDLPAGWQDVFDKEDFE